MAIYALDYSVAICLPDESDPNRPGTMIGWQKLFNVDLAAVHHRNRVFAIVLDPAHHGKGYGTEALNWLCKIGFQYGGLHRIHANCFSINSGGLRCYEKVCVSGLIGGQHRDLKLTGRARFPLSSGFKVEGVERDAYWYNGHWVNRIRV